MALAPGMQESIADRLRKGWANMRGRGNLKSIYGTFENYQTARSQNPTMTWGGQGTTGQNTQGQTNTTTPNAGQRTPTGAWDYTTFINNLRTGNNDPVADWSSGEVQFPNQQQTTTTPSTNWWSSGVTATNPSRWAPNDPNGLFAGYIGAPRMVNGQVQFSGTMPPETREGVLSNWNGINPSTGQPLNNWQSNPYLSALNGIGWNWSGR